MTTITWRRLAAAAVLSLGAAACTDLTTEPRSTVSGTNVFDEPGAYRSFLAKLYAGLGTTGQADPDAPDSRPDIQGIDAGFSQYIRLLWQMQELPTDEAAIAWGGDDGVQALNTQEWTPNNQFSVAMYNRVFFQVGMANEFLRETTSAQGCSGRGVRVRTCSTRCGANCSPAVVASRSIHSNRSAPQAAVRLLVASAHVGVHSREPHLLKVLGPILLHLVLAVEPAALINSECVPNDADAGVAASELVRRGIPYPSNGRDGVPHAQKVDPEMPLIITVKGRTGEGPAELLAKPPVFFTVASHGSEQLYRVRQHVMVAARQQPQQVQHPRQHACGICAAAEPEDEHQVTVLPIVHQIGVRLLHIAHEPGPER